MAGAARRAGSLTGFVLAGSWVFYLETTWIGIPTRLTLDAARADLTDALDLFHDVVAPTVPETGFVLATAFGFWVSAFFSDWSAFRLSAPLEAIVPPTALFVFASVLGDDQRALGFAGIHAGAIIVFLLLHRTAVQAERPGWMADDSGKGATSMLRVGAVLTALAVVLGVAAGPRLPGADAEALVDWKDVTPGSGGSRITISPLVDIKSRLVNQEDVEVFTVRSTERAYWRLTSLNRFDGRIWSSDGSYSKADGDLPDQTAGVAATRDVVQDFQIEALSAIWLPGAFEPTNILLNPDSPATRFDSQSSTLITEQATSDGMTYTLQSSVPTFDAAALDLVGAEVPDDVADRYLDLPSDLDRRVGELAAQLTQGLETPYRKALALQNHFRDNYLYDLTIDSGHGNDDIGDFLFGDRRAGYCEQFAGTFGAMARSIGLPSRVAVGFTPGDVDPEDPMLYHVTGRHAHAWPEVYLAGYGWVAFEPTPGRGAPGAFGYTGVNEAQDGGVDAQATTTTSVPASEQSIPLDDTPFPEFGEGGIGSSSAAGNDRSSLGTTILTVIAVLAALAAAYAIAVPLLLRRRRALRRAGANTANERVQLAWREANESMGLVGISRRSSETELEFAERVRDVIAIDGDPHARLAETVATASYSGRAIDETTVPEADSAAARIEARLSCRGRCRPPGPPRARPPPSRQPLTRPGCPRGPPHRIGGHDPPPHRIGGHDPPPHRIGGDNPPPHRIGGDNPPPHRIGGESTPPHRRR